MRAGDGRAHAHGRQRAAHGCHRGGAARAVPPALFGTALFPPAEEEDEELSAQLASFVPARRIQISHEALLGALRGMARKSAGGLSGMTTDCLLDPLLDSGELREALLPVLQLVADGALPAAAVPLLADCRLIGLLKATGKLRPIAMGEWLRRLVGRLLLRAHTGPVRGYVEPVQLGVGTPCGVETAARAAQGFLHSPLGAGRVLVTVDLRDAFQKVSRAAYFRVLLGRPDLGGLVPYTRLLYSGPSTMWYRVTRHGGCVCVRVCVRARGRPGPRPPPPLPERSTALGRRGGSPPPPPTHSPAARHHARSLPRSGWQAQTGSCRTRSPAGCPPHR